MLRAARKLITMENLKALWALRKGGSSAGSGNKSPLARNFSAQNTNLSSNGTGAKLGSQGKKGISKLQMLRAARKLLTIGNIKKLRALSKGGSSTGSDNKSSDRKITALDMRAAMKKMRNKISKEGKSSKKPSVKSATKQKNPKGKKGGGDPTVTLQDFTDTMKKMRNKISKEGKSSQKPGVKRAPKQKHPKGNDGGETDA